MAQARNALPGAHFVIAREQVPDNGEDSYCCTYGKKASLLAVFDGCGGSGARRHARFSGKTEAYMASRLCAGVFHDSFGAVFSQNAEGSDPEGLFVQEIARRWDALMARFDPSRADAGSGLRSSMIRPMPTTAAALVIRPAEEDRFAASAIWAGDSRAYALSDHGLMQLSQDDATEKDPMKNLYGDSIMTRTVDGAKGARLHLGTVTLTAPFLAITATDGCFAYLSTPMEFEGLLLESLMASESTAQWEQRLDEGIGEVAGDDYTLCLAAYGFDSFRAMQAHFRPRLRHLQAEYLKPLAALAPGDLASREALWQQYRTDYLNYVKEV
ncbi:MAG: hypothetical protein E7464_05970 [Ruminococcaceae bacterium]|nr:hypothetical protein [Oscillospiraceae bacterium]